MRCTVFSSKRYDRQFLESASGDHAFTFLEPRLTLDTAALAEGRPAACLFVNDDASADVVAKLAEVGVTFLVLRSAGFNNVDLDACREHGIRVARVPAYAPAGVAEHAVGLMLALNRHLHKAYHRVREGNFALDGLLGFEMHGKTAGVVGTGLIGAACCRILCGFGMRVLAHDPNPDDTLDVEYVDLDTLLGQSDVVSLHAPLLPATRHMINADALATMKDGAMLINTSRGALVDTPAVIDALKTKKLGALGLDVYEEEDGLFFDDHSADILDDDTFARLLTFPNVLITGHQAFFTREALDQIARTTVANLDAFEAGGECKNEVRAE
ncbi:MAG: 2-hydroxyacid dehydrogenase [Planctomycetota bacterium]